MVQCRKIFQVEVQEIKYKIRFPNWLRRVVWEPGDGEMVVLSAGALSTPSLRLLPPRALPDDPPPAWPGDSYGSKTNCEDVFQSDAETCLIFSCPQQLNR